METKISIEERVKELYKYAIARGKVSSKQEFADLVGITNVTLSRFLNGKKEPSKKTIEQINNALGNPFDNDWLITGKGEMMSSAPTQPTPTPTEPVGCEAFSSAIHELIVEMRESRIAKDEQIDRLLTIIENMQKN